ncbi:MAG: succinate dehydrogenase assembly factor 2 [Pseudomonadota bacterium]
MSEPPEARLKRLTMRSWRRGTKEMDLILGPFADKTLAQMSDTELREYDALLSENDQDLYQWVTGQAAAPERFSALIARIAASSVSSAG